MPHLVRRARTVLQRSDGQMAVEVAVLIPVVLAVVIIAADLMVYVSEAARFDHVAAQVVLAQGVSSPGSDFVQEDRSSAVLQAAQEEFSKDFEEVELETEDVWGVVTYSFTLKVTPWPIAGGGSLAGTPLALTHTYAIAVDPFVAGRL